MRDSWDPLGRALLDYHRGDVRARFLVHSDLWEDEWTPVEEYYRPDHVPLPEIEKRALSACRGRVLDLGAGAGRHALELQRRGFEVTALDVSPDAVIVMRERGVDDARCGDLSTVASETFDTVLLLMHGIGLAGTLDGLRSLLARAGEMLGDGGRIVCDSADLSMILPHLATRKNAHLEASIPYFGEVEFRLTYGAMRGSPYPWLFVDPGTLERTAAQAGFAVEIAARGVRGAYLALLRRLKMVF
jgi:SAM-dependent methyltransferase